MSNKPLYFFLLGLRLVITLSFFLPGLSFIFPNIVITAYTAVLFQRFSFKKQLILFIPENILAIFRSFSGISSVRIMTIAIFPKIFYSVVLISFPVAILMNSIVLVLITKGVGYILFKKYSDLRGLSNGQDLSVL